MPIELKQEIIEKHEHELKYNGGNGVRSSSHYWWVASSIPILTTSVDVSSCIQTASEFMSTKPKPRILG